MKQKNKNSYATEAAARKQTDGMASKVKASNSHSNEHECVIMVPKSDAQLEALSQIAYVAQLTFNDIDSEGRCEFSRSFRLRTIPDESEVSVILKKGQQFLILSVPSDIDGLRSVLSCAAHTTMEEEALSQCALCLYPHQKNVQNDFSYVADKLMLDEIRKCKGGSTKKFMKQLKALARQQDAATMYRVAEFFYEQGDFGSMLELKLAAGDDNYSPAISDLKHYAEMLDSIDEEGRDMSRMERSSKRKNLTK